MKRTFDIIISFVGLSLLSPLILLIAVLIKVTSRGPVIYWSERVGQYNIPFQMPKFRTMVENTPALPSRDIERSQHYITPFGSFLRKTSLDELPQLWSILKGEMSFVGPRPVLPYEKDLIALRVQKGVHTLVPGLTGWAQINGRDRVTLEQKVLYDSEYGQKKCFFFDLFIILRTIPLALLKKDVTH